MLSICTEQTGAVRQMLRNLPQVIQKVSETVCEHSMAPKVHTSNHYPIFFPKKAEEREG